MAPTRRHFCMGNIELRNLNGPKQVKPFIDFSNSPLKSAFLGRDSKEAIDADEIPNNIFFN